MRYINLGLLLQFLLFAVFSLLIIRDEGEQSSFEYVYGRDLTTRMFHADFGEMPGKYNEEKRGYDMWPLIFTGQISSQDTFCLLIKMEDRPNDWVLPHRLAAEVTAFYGKGKGLNDGIDLFHFTGLHPGCAGELKYSFPSPMMGKYLDKCYLDMAGRTYELERKLFPTEKEYISRFVLSVKDLSNQQFQILIFGYTYHDISVPGILWAGDLDRDNRLDIITIAESWVFPGGRILEAFMSSYARPDEVVHRCGIGRNLEPTLHPDSTSSDPYAAIRKNMVRWGQYDIMYVPYYRQLIKFTTGR